VEAGAVAIRRWKPQLVERPDLRQDPEQLGAPAPHPWLALQVEERAVEQQPTDARTLCSTGAGVETVEPQGQDEPTGGVPGQQHRCVVGLLPDRGQGATELGFLVEREVGDVVRRLARAA
jgi:hypothetical protein